MEYLLTDEVKFESKPDAVPYNYRMSYKVAQICMIISKSSNGCGGCSIIKLHIISNALETKDGMNEVERYLEGKEPYFVVRFDPAINRGIKFGIADGLVEQLKCGTYKVSAKGKNLVKKIEDNNLMSCDIENIILIGKKITKEKIDDLQSRWRYDNVEN